MPIHSRDIGKIVHNRGNKLILIQQELAEMANEKIKTLYANENKLVNPTIRV